MPRRTASESSRRLFESSGQEQDKHTGNRDFRLKSASAYCMYTVMHMVMSSFLYSCTME
jgi:hypothetical protein